MKLASLVANHFDMIRWFADEKLNNVDKSSQEEYGWLERISRPMFVF